MVNKKVTNLASLDKLFIADVYKEALQNSYVFWCDKLDCSKSYSRERTDKSFSKVLSIAFLDKAAHWTILFRDKVFNDDMPHWEFGVRNMSGIEYFIWIKVRPDIAIKIFDKFNLTVMDY